MPDALSLPQGLHAVGNRPTTQEARSNLKNCHSRRPVSIQYMPGGAVHRDRLVRARNPALEPAQFGRRKGVVFVVHVVQHPAWPTSVEPSEFNRAQAPHRHGGNAPQRLLTQWQAPGLAQLGCANRLIGTAVFVFALALGSCKKDGRSGGPTST